MKKIVINNFKAFSEELSIDLDNKNFLLYGENGAGKSSIYEALRIAFFNDKISKGIRRSAVPEDNEQRVKDFWGKYNNRITNKDFEIKINEFQFKELNLDEYQVFMMSLDELVLKDDSIKLKTLLNSLNFNIDDITEFCEMNKVALEEKVNKKLLDFKENISIEIDVENDYTIKIIDSSRNLSSEIEIRKYFNEAKINLVILLLGFCSIELSRDDDKISLLILDDFITSLDIANRTLLMRYVIEEFKDFQKLIFTHNINFYNLTIYLIGKSEEHKWKFANIFEIGGRNVFYFKDSQIKLADIKKKYKDIKTCVDNASNASTVNDIGNLLRQKFEILLYELSKLLMLESVQESKSIIERMEMSKPLYIKKVGKVYKKSSDLLVEIEALLVNPPENLKESLINKIKKYKIDEVNILKEVIRDLKIYQKVSLHPMSHAVLGQSSFQTKEIEMTIELVDKLEQNIKSLVNKDIARV